MGIIAAAGGDYLKMRDYVAIAKRFGLLDRLYFRLQRGVWRKGLMIDELKEKLTAIGSRIDDLQSEIAVLLQCSHRGVRRLDQQPEDRSVVLLGVFDFEVSLSMIPDDTTAHRQVIWKRKNRRIVQP